MKFLVLFMLCGTQILLADSKIFPTRLPQPCSKSVPNYSDCAYKMLKKMGPHLLKGVREINFPRMYPLDIPLFIINRTLNNFISIDAVLKNAQFWGFDQTQMESFKFDTKNMNGEISLHFPYLRTSFEFESSGRFLEFVLLNAGNIKMNSTNVNVDFKFKLKQIEKLGVKYYAFENFKATGTVDDSTFKMVSKNPDDQAAADVLTNFVVTNFKTAFNAMQPIFNESLEVFYKYLAEQVLNTVPAQELIPE